MVGGEVDSKDTQLLQKPFEGQEAFCCFMSLYESRTTKNTWMLCWRCQCVAVNPIITGIYSILIYGRPNITTTYYVGPERK